MANASTEQLGDDVRSQGEYVEFRGEADLLSIVDDSSLLEWRSSDCEDDALEGFDGICLLYTSDAADEE